MKLISLLIAALLVAACTVQLVTGNDNEVSDQKSPNPTLEAHLPLP
jgi:hypothetical protein